MARHACAAGRASDGSSDLVELNVEAVFASLFEGRSVAGHNLSCKAEAAIGATAPTKVLNGVDERVSAAHLRLGYTAGTFGTSVAKGRAMVVVQLSPSRPTLTLAASQMK